MTGCPGKTRWQPQGELTPHDGLPRQDPVAQHGEPTPEDGLALRDPVAPRLTRGGPTWLQ